VCYISFMNNRVVHFEIQASDTARAVKFYTEVFGWTCEQWGDKGYWMVMTAPKGSTEPGINGGLMPRPAETPPQQCGTNAFVCTIQVDSYNDMEAKILAAGGVVAMPKFALTGMAWQGYYLDTEGNTFGLHQTDPEAK
jgi:predicted enzyme related to lactoylglutathione lyase